MDKLHIPFDYVDFSIYNSSCICDKRTFMATDFPRAYVEFDSHILFDRVWIHVSTSLSG